MGGPLLLPELPGLQVAALPGARTAPVVPGLRSLLEFAHPVSGLIGFAFWLGYTFVRLPRAGLDRVRAGGAHRLPGPDLVRGQHPRGPAPAGAVVQRPPHGAARRGRCRDHHAGRPDRPGPIETTSGQCTRPPARIGETSDHRARERWIRWLDGLAAVCTDHYP